MLQVGNMPRTYTKGLVAVGSNLPSSAGDARDTVLFALGLLADDSVGITAQSRLFQTPAFPVGAGPDFVNAVVEVETDLSAEALLAHLHKIEALIGRTRETRWGARVIDLDLLAFADLVLPDVATLKHWLELPPHERGMQAPDQLILPHPRMQERGFVLIPLMDLAPDWRHPYLGLTVRQMVEKLPKAEKAAVIALD
jgi:2-amino-4-hydroxy-6-hydroxymethyldihydropteridine diphosphokinase